MLVADEPIKDIGRVRFGQVYTFNYTLTNTGDRQVTIRKLQVGCGSCTVATVNNNKVAPGASVIVRVEFTPGTISKQKKHIDVLYSDTSLRLEFKGESYA